MKLCRFKNSRARVGVGLLHGDMILDLGGVGISQMTTLLESADLSVRLRALGDSTLPHYRLHDVELLPPIERQEVWAAGVTYLRSKAARMDESAFSATAYDRVYDAARPELFFKALPEKVVGPGSTVGIRKDARWSVPEPELALVINSRGQIAGYTIGNDMSSRDIEGENLLYLPQAKIYEQSCALGPAIRVGVDEAEARTWRITLNILRGGIVAFVGETTVGQLKRRFEDLVGYLFRAQTFPYGVVLLTGTGIVPPGDFSLQPGDEVTIEISGVGILTNRVTEVG
jgi:2-dehydro-3-deoxy-D-arabinonate dehydratase